MKQPVSPPQLHDLLRDVEPERLVPILGGGTSVAPGGHYYHWNKLRYRPPPDGLSSREWWLAVKVARMQARRELPLTDVE